MLDEYIDMGCLTQVNISSFSDSSRHIRKRLLKYLENRKIHLIGSDCYNLTSRPPDYAKGAKEIIKECSKDAIDRLEQNANLLIKS